MTEEHEVMTLPAAQAAVLESLADGESRSVEDVAEETDEKPETVTGAAFALEEDGIIDIDERTERRAVVTAEGERYLEEGLPEVRLHESASLMAGVDEPVPLGDVIENAGLTGRAVDIALSNFARKGYGSIENGQLVIARLSVEDDEEEGLSILADTEDADALDPDVLDRLERRNLIKLHEVTSRRFSLTAQGNSLVKSGIAVADELGTVTPTVLISGEWRDRNFRAYNVAADAPLEIGGNVHSLRQMAERVKDVLIGMGFREMEGPHVDADFWINDCLFMPQDHPARTHWDRFELESPRTVESLPPGLVERVRAAHRRGVGEDGEGYHSPWEESVARDLALRGHTTSLSARYLSGEAIGDLEPPQRFFSVEKVYRNDTLDATHLLEFFQIEGWVMAEALSVRDLMGTFTEFYEQFGITDLEFKPHYNPYTEPSFELFGTHPRTGELIEIGNSGIFRPEMLEPLQVECDVMAWGLALERLMMLVTGAEDIRDVHGTLVDLDFLRTQEVLY